jgi:hypothetical protein
MHSIIQARSKVPFPAYQGERVYMRPFIKAQGLPFDLRRWQPTVDAMLEGIETNHPIYLMVDQGFVKAGTPQRRPGVHIDGYWIPGLQAHGQPDRGGHRHPTPEERPPYRGDHNTRPRHCTGGVLVEEALLLASDIQGCVGYTGGFDGLIGTGGDCSHLSLQGLQRVPFKANTCYAGNVTSLHESLPVATDCNRTLVRLNVPGYIVE